MISLRSVLDAQEKEMESKESEISGLMEEISSLEEKSNKLIEANETLKQEITGKSEVNIISEILFKNPIFSPLHVFF